MEISKVQDGEVVDGTTNDIVLASELLHEAEKLISAKIHPQTIFSGWRKAVKVARAALEAAAIDHGDEALFREDLLNIERTTISSKILTQIKQQFAELGMVMMWWRALA